MTLETMNLQCLTAEQVERYRRDGFLILRSVFSPAEAAELSVEADGLLERHRGLIDKKNLRCRFQSHHASGESLFETFDPVIDIAPVCQRIAHDVRILDVLADLYGEPACLFKDKLIFKPPGAQGYVLHQDFIAWDGFPRSFVTVLVPIDAADAENGCTEVFPGHHLAGPLTPEDGQFHELPVDAVDVSKSVKLELAPGDIAIFGGFTPHRSAPNGSPNPRRQLYLSYNAFSDGGGQRERHYLDFHAYLRRKYRDRGVTDLHFH
ncbi:MAG: phytanoyl-CoA dioxygenase family protein [Planctomycetaceae bacterium]|nr:phytanoyl-CoA dioxygenase family protein [Planctomycetaceae bacterium]